MSMLDNFSTWKDYLKDKLNEAENKGIKDNVISNIAYQVGDYLNEQVEPHNEEQRLLQDMWNAANEEEQRAIANTMIKLVQND